MEPPITPLRSPLYKQDNDCYITALAIFLGIPWHVAFRLMRGQAPPPEDVSGDLAWPVSKVYRRLRALGLRMRRGGYKGRKGPALVAAEWARPPSWARGMVHFTVWDGHHRVDPNGEDTFARYGAKNIRVFEWP